MSLSNALRSASPWLARLALLALLLAPGITAGCGADDVGGTGEANDPATGDDDDDSPDAGSGSKRDGSTRPPPSGDDDEGDDDVGDDDDDESNSCAAIEKEAPPAKGGVDIVFLVDTSPSMLHALQQVTQNMAMFVQQFESTTVDTRVVVITQLDPAANSPLASQRDKYRFIASEVDSKALFTVALGRFNDYKDFLRPNAATQFVMITDDEDLVPPATFKSEMEQLLGHGFTQHAIASEDAMGAPCVNEVAQMTNPLCMFVIPGVGGIPAICGAAAIGKAYYALADDTGGEKLSICKGDWTDVFARLKEAVVEAVPLPCDYPLDQVDEDYDPENVSLVYRSPDKKSSDFPKAMTPDRCADKAGWHYDDNAKPSTIVLCPAACELVRGGGSIKVALGCPPQVFL